MLLEHNRQLTVQSEIQTGGVGLHSSIKLISYSKPSDLFDFQIHPVDANKLTSHKATYLLESMQLPLKPQTVSYILYSHM